MKLRMHQSFCTLTSIAFFRPRRIPLTPVTVISQGDKPVHTKKTVACNGKATTPKSAKEDTVAGKKTPRRIQLTPVSKWGSRLGQRRLVYHVWLPITCDAPLLRVVIFSFFETYYKYRFWVVPLFPASSVWHTSADIFGGCGGDLGPVWG